MASQDERAESRGCDVAVRTDTGDPALPVAGSGELSRIRRSRNAPWRAAVLIGVHALVALHVTHFLVAGRTLSPVEPSESMYSLELGYLNAGFIFFAVALLATLVFGRFFCGWGCHIVALQDLCAWLMKRVGIRPRPFRSRLLAYAPWVVALYMFVWPTLRRVAFGAGPEFPGWSNHLITEGFWDTFPGPLFAILTFVTCGFAAVYVLGAKGFCTYGCPYGAFFGAVDAFAPGRIRVTDACLGCGHCTATCTSNVRVHEEVKLYGKVVDPGCMKCMDCVSVCPTDALYFGFGAPAAFSRQVRPGRRARRWDFAWGEELLIGAAAIGGTLAWRGLYDGPPLLMSVALGGLTAYAAIKVWHLARRPTVRLQNLTFKAGGRLSVAGSVFAVVAVGWLLLTAHGGFVQWHRARGAHWLERTEATRADVLAGVHTARDYSTDHHRAAALSRYHFARAERWGLVGVPEVELGLAWSELLEGRTDAAAARVRQAIALTPDNAAQYDNLVDIYAGQGRWAETIEALELKLAAVPATALDEFRLAGLLVEAGRIDEAVERFEASVELDPEFAPAHYNLGGLLRRMGRIEPAVRELELAAMLAPADQATWIELGLARAAAGDTAGAIEALRRAIELDPEGAAARLQLPDLIRQLEGGS